MIYGQLIHEIIGRIDHDGQAVVGDGQFDEFDVVFFAQCDFRTFDRPRRVRNVSRAGHEFLEPSTRTGETDRHLDIGKVFSEFFRNLQADGVDRA